MKVYLDHAATTKVAPLVLKAMEPYFAQKFGNPSSLHQWGQEARRALQEARGKLASFLNCQPEELIFTSCATESNNLIIKGLVWAYLINHPGSKSKTRLHLITSSIEHHSVLHPCQALEKAGLGEVTYLPVSSEGLVEPEEVAKAIRENTILVSLMYANNEIGTIQPIAKIGEIISQIKEERKRKGNQLPLYFHTDAVQAFQYLDCDVQKLKVDALSLTGHKFYAPKGIGLLYLKKGIPLVPQLDGGGQERGFRSGTENVPYVVGLAKAAEIVFQKKEQEKRRLLKLRDRLIKGILKKIPRVVLAGSLKERLPNNVNVCFEGLEGESLVLKLNQAGIAASTGSACSSSSLEPSHVLLALGFSPQLAHGSLRLTLGQETRQKEIDYVLEVLPRLVNQLRQMNPLWRKQND